MLQEQTKKSMIYTTKASSLKVCNESKGWAIVQRSSSRRKVVKPALEPWDLANLYPFLKVFSIYVPFARWRFRFSMIRTDSQVPSAGHTVQSIACPINRRGRDRKHEQVEEEWPE